MELKDFVKNAIIELDKAVTEASVETGRKIRLRGVKEKRTALEFDIAVTVDSTENGKVGAGIKVLEFINLGTDISTQSKNQTVSRITFGVDVPELTEEEIRLDNKLSIYDVD